MKNRFLKILFLGILYLHNYPSFSQSIPAGSAIFEESLRRKQLLGQLDSSISFNIRPLRTAFLFDNPVYNGYAAFELENGPGKISRKSIQKTFSVLPLKNTFSFNSGRPYGWGNGPMIPNVGFQNLFSAGISARYYFINIQFQPEILWAQNKSYPGYFNDFPDEVNQARFHFWNNGDYPERFGTESYSSLGWGQSKFSLSAGAFELGISTENIWWGPGQFNALILSNNSMGFPHISLNTTRPARTFLGSFEGQIIMGRLEPSGFEPSQYENLNEAYFRTLSEDWRYLNGISVSYQPKWTPGLSLGLNRTFQQYNQFRTDSFQDWFPIFEVFTKEELFEDGSTVDYDGRAQDQQVSVFSRYVLPRARAEVYFEYGRRDHAFNWREFLVNPEHARAYILGFAKLFPLNKENKFFQVRGEMTQQQESVNRYVRYLGLGGGTSWHTHYQVRGFSHFGQALGVGIGSAGSNVQTLEVSIIDNLNKYGLRLERLANQQDFFSKAFGQQEERKPWVDLSLALLLDYRWNRWIISSKLQLINGLNYQWQLEADSTQQFPKGKNKFSIFAETNFIFLLGKI